MLCLSGERKTFLRLDCLLTLTLFTKEMEMSLSSDWYHSYGCVGCTALPGPKLSCSDPNTTPRVWSGIIGRDFLLPFGLHAQPLSSTEIAGHHRDGFVSALWQLSHCCGSSIAYLFPSSATCPGGILGIFLSPKYY